MRGGAERGWRGVGKTVATEFGTEAVEEGATQYSGRAAAQQYNPEINPMEGVVGSGLLGGVLGAGTATPIALMNMQREPQAIDDTPNYDLTQRGQTAPSEPLGRAPNVSNWTDENLKQTLQFQMNKETPNQALVLALMDELDLRVATGKSISPTIPTAAAPAPAAPTLTPPPAANTVDPELDALIQERTGLKPNGKLRTYAKRVAGLDLETTDPDTEVAVRSMDAWKTTTTATITLDPSLPPGSPTADSDPTAHCAPTVTLAHRKRKLSLRQKSLIIGG
jgi:hypothetical protein